MRVGEGGAGDNRAVGGGEWNEGKGNGYIRFNLKTVGKKMRENAAREGGREEEGISCEGEVGLNTSTQKYASNLH